MLGTPQHAVCGVIMMSSCHLSVTYTVMYQLNIDADICLSLVASCEAPRYQLLKLSTWEFQYAQLFSNSCVACQVIISTSPI